MQNVFDKLWHKVLRRPYRVVCTIDEGSGPAAVLLHGLASTSDVWRTLAKLLTPSRRVVAGDLLGFGVSPKPDWLDYTVEDHAQAVLAMLKKQGVVGPVTIVGHSMGCLVAVHIARLRPAFVERLVLYELPLYIENPSLRRYALLQRVYFAVYNRVLKHPKYSPTNARIVQKLAARIAGFEITKQTWTPFVKSIKNTVLTQTAAEDIKRLSLPVDIIFGTRDIVVRPGMVQAVFGQEAKHVTMHTVAAHHNISQGASAYIANLLTPEALVFSSKILYKNRGETQDV